jgi:hypothetical protein
MAAAAAAARSEFRVELRENELRAKGNGPGVSR